MQTWESLFGIKGLDRASAFNVSNNEDIGNKTQLGRLSLCAGLQSALNYVASERAAGKVVFPP
ncbi:MAG: uracil-DNA glycosylase, partial [Glaciecola sp.]